MDTINLMHYSPTGTTQKVVKEIGQNLELKLTSEYNITKIQTESISEVSDNCLTIIGVPVYGGRLPMIAVDALRKFHSNHSPAVIVVVYGNRAFEDSLLELNEIVSTCGFHVIAAAAFIGEHSYSSIDKPIAPGRPDKLDLMKCNDFSKMILDKLNSLKQGNKISEIDIPGNYPYKQRNQLPVNIYPETNNAKCDNCGICVDICPSNAITNYPITTNGELCTWCCACVKVCPNEARIFDNPTINAVKDRLFSACSDRKEPKYFI
ncbi:MAG: 4Fe-4S binding protein [Prolixibacteraceae bacterium]